MRVHSESDEQLLQRIRVGDAVAFGRLYDRYKGKLYGYCCRLLHNESWAEDAVHDTFLRIHAGVHSVNNPQSFPVWIFRIARNEALMMLREKKSTVEPDDTALWDNDTPLEVLARKEDLQLLQSLLDHLSVPYREVIVMREIEHFSYAEIADLTGTTVSSVKSRIFKARKALGARLESLKVNGRSER